MITEPVLDKEELKQAISDRYNLSVSELVFEPQGECSWSYVVVNNDGSKYFLKIHKGKLLSLKRLELLHELHSVCEIQNIAYPVIALDGSLEFIVAGYPAVLFNFIDGIAVERKRLNDDQLEKLGELLAQVHQSYTKIGSFEIRESFTHPYRAKIDRIYTELDGYSNLVRPQEEARIVYRDFANIFIEEIGSLDALGLVLSEKNIEFVNCHGEPSTGNILSASDRGVYLIDWDDPIFAPKEKDLMFFIKNLEPVLRGYGKYSRDSFLNPETLRYYQFLWNVSEIEDWAARIFLEQHSEHEYEYYLNHLKHFLDYSGLGRRFVS